MSACSASIAKESLAKDQESLAIFTKSLETLETSLVEAQEHQAETVAEAAERSAIVDNLAPVADQARVDLTKAIKRKDEATARVQAIQKNRDETTQKVRLYRSKVDKPEVRCPSSRPKLGLAAQRHLHQALPKFQRERIQGVKQAREAFVRAHYSEAQANQILDSLSLTDPHLHQPKRPLEVEGTLRDILSQSVGEGCDTLVDPDLLDNLYLVTNKGEGQGLEHHLSHFRATFVPTLNSTLLSIQEAERIEAEGRPQRVQTLIEEANQRRAVDIVASLQATTRRGESPPSKRPRESKDVASPRASAKAPARARPPAKAPTPTPAPPSRAITDYSTEELEAILKEKLAKA